MSAVNSLEMSPSSGILQHDRTSKSPADTKSTNATETKPNNVTETKTVDAADARMDRVSNAESH